MTTHVFQNYASSRHFKVPPQILEKAEMKHMRELTKPQTGKQKKYVKLLPEGKQKTIVTNKEN